MKSHKRQRLKTLLVNKNLELQELWQNPISDEDRNFNSWDFKESSDDELKEQIRKISSLIRYEKRKIYIEKIINILIVFFCLFIFLGVIGLCVFGIKQLF